MIRHNMTRADVEAVGSIGAKTIREGYTQTVCILGDIPVRILRDDISLSPSLRTYGYWESWITSWFTHNITPGSRFVDIGANMGYFSFVAEELGAHVRAFEPNPMLARLIVKSTSFNDFGIAVDTRAVSNKNSKATLFIPGEYDGSASITTDFEGQYPTRRIEVETVKLDATIVSYGVDLIKMDIEGAEENAWDGMQQTLAVHKPVVVLEYTSGRYSKEFPQKLDAYGDLSVITHDGDERMIPWYDLEGFSEFEMVVVRP